MTYRTLKVSTIDSYLSFEDDADEKSQRAKLLIQFPHPVMLELSFPEVDVANRWCWQHFGPDHGECLQKGSEYRACLEDHSHSHLGKWAMHWFTKTDYNFGFAEWYFSEEADRDRFLEAVPSFDWGENYPK